MSSGYVTEAQPAWWPPQPGDLLIEGVSADPDAFYLVNKYGTAFSYDGVLTRVELEERARQGNIRLSFRRNEGLAW